MAKLGDLGLSGGVGGNVIGRLVANLIGDGRLSW